MPGVDSPESIERANAVEHPRESRGEIIDVTTREVWQDVDPTPRAWWDSLELEPPLLKAGYGSGNMDRTWFRRSPDAAADGPVRRREIAGRDFFHCASTTGAMEEDTPRRLLVDKHHTLVYDARRSVEILTTKEGRDFVLVVQGDPETSPPELPDGWSIRTLQLDAEWIVELPNPTETFWFRGPISYQGPLTALPGRS
jgi:hypothetical protein